MYTLRKNIQSLADEAHVKEECGPYVTKPGLFPAINQYLEYFDLTFYVTGKQVPDWPRLLHLYSRLKPGKTVLDWMKAYDVETLGIDVRRFTSFGVVKVHSAQAQSF